MDFETVKWLLQEYGPMVMGWVVAFILWLRLSLVSDTHRKDVIGDYQRLHTLTHEAIVENTKITERLALLIEERTRQRLNGPN